MSLRTWLLGLTVVVTVAVVLQVLRNPRVSALIHQGIPDRPKRRLFLAAIGFL